MVASISSSTVSNWSDSLFNKLDTKKQGYVDQSDLAAALGTDETGSTRNSDDAAEMLKQIDGDGDGKITKSELSTAVSKVADELNAQFDSSRVDKSQAEEAAGTTAAAGAMGSAKGAANTDAAASSDDDAALSVSSTTGTGSTAVARGAAPTGGGSGAASASSSTDTNKYVQAADTDANGEVSDTEAAAYKKLLEKMAEHAQEAHAAHGPKGNEKGSGAKPADSTDSADSDLARALDQLKQYVDNSGAAGSTTASTSQAVDTTA